MDICHHKFAQTTEYTPKVNCNYGLWVTMMYPQRFIGCNKCTDLMGDADNGEGHACVQAGSI